MKTLSIEAGRLLAQFRTLDRELGNDPYDEVGQDIEHLVSRLYPHDE